MYKAGLRNGTGFSKLTNLDKSVLCYYKNGWVTKGKLDFDVDKTMIKKYANNRIDGLI